MNVTDELYSNRSLVSTVADNLRKYAELLEAATTKCGTDPYSVGIKLDEMLPSLSNYLHLNGCNPSADMCGCEDCEREMEVLSRNPVLMRFSTAKVDR